MNNSQVCHNWANQTKTQAKILNGANNMRIKTIDANAKTWWDRVNGNTYFSAQITINFGMKNQKTIYMPFQYGYGDYHHEVFSELIKKGLLKSESVFGYWQFYKENKIIYRYSKQTNCLQKEVKKWGSV